MMNRALLQGITFVIAISATAVASDKDKKLCGRGFGGIPNGSPIALDGAGLPLAQGGEPQGRAFGDFNTFDVPFDPQKDHVVVTIGGEGHQAEMTLATMIGAGSMESKLTFPATNPEKTFTTGRPKTGGGGAAAAAVVDVKDLPPDYFEQRRKPSDPKPRSAAADPYGINLISRGQLTWKRSADGASIVLTNGIFDTQGRFVPARNKIRVSSEKPSNWNDVKTIPPNDNEVTRPEEVTVELVPRAKPYWVMLPNGAVFTVQVSPQAGAVPKVTEVKKVDTKPYEARLTAGLGSRPATGEVVTLKSKPRLPDHPNGNHYVGSYQGIVEVDGQAYVVLQAGNRKNYLYPAERIDFAEAKKGIDPKLIAAGPGNLLAKARTPAINPVVKRFDARGDAAKQLNDYFGGYAHPKDGVEGWHTYATAQRGVDRGGNIEGAREIVMPNGRSAIAKTYTEPVSDPRDIEAIVSGLRRMEIWASEGRGPKIFGVGYKLTGTAPNQRVAITIIMENMTPYKKQGSGGADLTVAGGDAAYISKAARDLPESARVWLRDSLLLASSPSNHPDGHLLNVGYRITHIRSDADLPSHGNYYRVGDQVVEIYAVDAVGKLAEQTIAGGDFLMKQYDPAAKRKYLSRELGLND